jgi:hypothetical protein
VFYATGQNLIRQEQLYNSIQDRDDEREARRPAGHRRRLQPVSFHAAVVGGAAVLAHAAPQPVEAEASLGPQRAGPVVHGQGLDLVQHRARRRPRPGRRLIGAGGGRRVVALAQEGRRGGHIEVPRAPAAVAPRGRLLRGSAAACLVAGPAAAAVDQLQRLHDLAHERPVRCLHVHAYGRDGRRLGQLLEVVARRHRRVHQLLQTFLAGEEWARPDDEVLGPRRLGHVHGLPAGQQLQEHHPVAVHVALDKQAPRHCILWGNVSAKHAHK